MATVAIVNVPKTRAALHQRIRVAVGTVADDAYDEARLRVPVRKVFAYGRVNEGLTSRRVRGRQDVRTLSLEEALGESLSRHRLKLPSPFPTDASGRRLPGSQPLVRTAQLTPGYFSQNRANRSSSKDEDIEARREIRRIEGRNRLVTRQDVTEPYTVQKTGERRERKIGVRFVVNEEAESDLSGRGRYELGRAKGPTLGGTLRRSITRPQVTRRGRLFLATIRAGSKEAYYAKYVEFGTRRSRAQPFMRAAKAKAKGEYMQVMRDSLMGLDILKGR